MSDLENNISQSINDAMPIYKELKEREKREKNRPDPVYILWVMN